MAKTPRFNCESYASSVSGAVFRSSKSSRTEASEVHARTTTSPRPIDGDLPEAARGCGRGVPLRPAYGAIEDPDSTRLHKVIVVVSPHVVVAIPNLDGFTMMPCWTIEVYFSQTYPPRGRRNQILCVSNIVGDAALFAKNCDPA